MARQISDEIAELLRIRHPGVHRGLVPTVGGVVRRSLERQYRPVYDVGRR